MIIKLVNDKITTGDNPKEFKDVDEEDGEEEEGSEEGEPDLIFKVKLDKPDPAGVKISKKNAVHDLCDDTLRVKYTFDNSKDMALEPICMFAMVFSLFIICMILTRIGFDTGVPNKKIVDESKQKTN